VKKPSLGEDLNILDVAGNARAAGKWCERCGGKPIEQHRKLCDECADFSRTKRKEYMREARREWWSNNKDQANQARRAKKAAASAWREKVAG
jgi:hypothetical protein